MHKLRLNLNLRTLALLFAAGLVMAFAGGLGATFGQWANDWEAWTGGPSAQAVYGVEQQDQMMYNLLASHGLNPNMNPSEVRGFLQRYGYKDLNELAQAQAEQGLTTPAQRRHTTIGQASYVYDKILESEAELSPWAREWLNIDRSKYADR